MPFLGETIALLRNWLHILFSYMSLQDLKLRSINPPTRPSSKYLFDLLHVSISQCGSIQVPRSPQLGAMGTVMTVHSHGITAAYTTVVHGQLLALKGLMDISPLQMVHRHSAFVFLPGLFHSPWHIVAFIPPLRSLCLLPQATCYVYVYVSLSLLISGKT